MSIIILLITTLLFAILTLLFDYFCKNSIKHSYFWMLLTYCSFALTVILGIISIISVLILIIK